MRRTALFLLLSNFLGTVHVVCGQGFSASTAAQAQSLADDLVKMHEAWGPAASTPNTSLAIREVTRSGPAIKLRLIANGVPKDAIYSLLAWPVTQKGPSQALKGVTVDESGLAVCAGVPGTCGSANKPNDPIDLVVQPVPGEPVRFGLVSGDGVTKVFAKLVPVPLRGEDRGCRVEAVILTSGAELVLIVGSGFSPNSEVTMDSSSEGERHGGKVKTDADGRYRSAILPYKKGLLRGTTTASLKAAQCEPSVKFPWGRGN